MKKLVALFVLLALSFPTTTAALTPPPAEQVPVSGLKLSRMSKEDTWFIKFWERHHRQALKATSR